MKTTGVLFWLFVCVSVYKRLRLSATGSSLSGEGGGTVGGIFRYWGTDTSHPNGGAVVSGTQDCGSEGGESQRFKSAELKGWGEGQMLWQMVPRQLRVDPRWTTPFL